MASWVNTISPNIYFNCFFWFRVIFIQCLPCILVTIFNGYLLETLKNAQKIQTELLTRSSTVRKTNRTTHMLVILNAVFLLVEVPLSVLTVLHTISSRYTFTLLEKASSSATPKCPFDLSESFQCAWVSGLWNSEQGDVVSEPSDSCFLSCQLCYLLQSLKVGPCNLTTQIIIHTSPANSWQLSRAWSQTLSRSSPSQRGAGRRKDTKDVPVWIKQSIQPWILLFDRGAEGIVNLS